MNWVAIIIVGLVCYELGWSAAHKMVATECKRNGGFFVGEENFRCTKIWYGEENHEVKD